MTIDISFIGELLKLPPGELLFILFIYGGWVVLVFFILGILWTWRLEKVRARYAASIEYILLAIDVPKDNEQGPKAVEQIFAHLAGVEDGGSWKEKYIQGFHRPYFSLEIISVEGYIQFLIRTPASFRDLVEAAIYAQYPDAEITEVEDYILNAPTTFPSEYDLWGTDLVLYNKDPYPIKTYPEFEESLSQEMKDPMAALLEALSKLNKAEQAWIQWVVTPVDEKWLERGERLIKKIVGAKDESKGFINKWVIGPAGEVGKSVIEIPYAGLTLETFDQSVGQPEKRSDAPSKIQYLTPGEKDVLKSIQKKMSKIPFKTKFRLVYFGQKEVFSKARVVGSLLGAIKQFNTLDMNGFKPDSKSKTLAKGFKAEKKLAKKQIKVLSNYKRRKPWMDGERGYILTTEELATLYHFPMIGVKAPLLKKTEMRRAEAPFALPVEQFMRVAENSLDEEENEEELEENMMPEKTIEQKNQKLEKAKEEVKRTVGTESSEKANRPPVNLPI